MASLLKFALVALPPEVSVVVNVPCSPKAESIAENISNQLTRLGTTQLWNLLEAKFILVGVN